MTKCSHSFQTHCYTVKVHCKLYVSKDLSEVDDPGEDCLFVCEIVC